MINHNREIIDLDEGDEVEHINYLSEFREKVWPIYQKEGMSFGDALIIWKLNTINNALYDLEEAVKGEKYE